MATLPDTPRPAVSVLAAAGAVDADRARLAVTRCRGDDPHTDTVDTTAVARDDPPLARLLAAYAQLAASVADALAAGDDPGACVQTRRPLLRRRVGEAADMRAELDALTRVPVVDTLVDDATSAAPDWAALAARARALDGDADRDAALVWATVGGRDPWPSPLDTATPWLVARHLTLAVRHARWRDRRSRRLAAVDVDAVEWWPDPQRLAAPDVGSRRRGPPG